MRAVFSLSVIAFFLREITRYSTLYSHVYHWKTRGNADVIVFNNKKKIKFKRSLYYCNVKCHWCYCYSSAMFKKYGFKTNLFTIKYM